MALGDGIRRSILDVDAEERLLLKNAIVELHNRFFAGARTDTPPGGVSFWFKQDEIHQATHVHGGPEFLPWHRELVNRFEALLRMVDSRLSLHYWDWTRDASPLFSPAFMGGGSGDAGDPWLAAGFYVPGADPYRGDSAFDPANKNPADPPRTLTRAYSGGTIPAATDTAIVEAADYQAMRALLEGAHNTSHGLIGGTLSDGHTSFRDPIVFLLHANVDRLFTRWQTDPAHTDRLDPELIYGSESAAMDELVEPWSTGHSIDAFGVEHFIRPWTAPESLGEPHTYKAPSIVTPPRYDTNFADAGRWKTLPYNTPHEVAHAAVLHTGKVLLIPADFNNDGWPTPIWDPGNEVSASFEYPVTNPDYALFCSGHCFLSDGQLFVAGGGGDLHVSVANKGFRFNPKTKEWIRAAGLMVESRWYPTCVALPDKRVLVVCGHGHGDMEVFSEATDTFAEVDGDDKLFPNLYPGLHYTPSDKIFFSRTGWGRATNGVPPANDDSAFFTLTAPTQGSWTDIVPSALNRCKGMSVMILSNRNTEVRVMVVGGADGGNGLNSAEVIDVSNLNAASAWSPTGALPDTNRRRQCNAVLLPDNTVFVAGGVSSATSPCMLYHHDTNSWTKMADIPSIRGYHSIAVLLPSGKVLVAGGTSGEGSQTMDVYSPPYLSSGVRPVISNAATGIRYNQPFFIETPDAPDVTKVVLVRPMAVTHQMDTEQRVIELSFGLDAGHPNRIIANAPGGANALSLAPQGYYMLFVLDGNNVPSVAHWVRLSKYRR